MHLFFPNFQLKIQNAPPLPSLPSEIVSISIPLPLQTAELIMDDPGPYFSKLNLETNLILAFLWIMNHNTQANNYHKMKFQKSRSRTFFVENFQFPLRKWG